MENLIENALLLLAAMLVFWAFAFCFVAWRAAGEGFAAHQANREISVPTIRGSLLGNIQNDTEPSEPRLNEGLALDLRTREFILQSRLSEEAVDEVLGVKV